MIKGLDMPYQPWQQFLKQRNSLRVMAYDRRSRQHSHWNNHSTFQPQSALLLMGLDAWMQQSPAGVQIDTHGIHPELLTGVENYGAILQGYLTYLPRILLPTAVATVIYDARNDKLYYGSSGFVQSMITMQVHAVLAAREQALPLTPVGVRTLVPNRSARTCSEFKALNSALHDGAQEPDLFCWAFRIRDMRPMPQCPNCRVTVARANLGRLWTG